MNTQAETTDAMLDDPLYRAAELEESEYDEEEAADEHDNLCDDVGDF